MKSWTTQSSWQSFWCYFMDVSALDFYKIRNKYIWKK